LSVPSCDDAPDETKTKLRYTGITVKHATFSHGSKMKGKW
jgi:hypothetical protein